MGVFVRACLIWILMLVAAVLNGAVRQRLLIPAIGEQEAHIVSTFLLSALLFGVGWLSASWLDLASSREAWTVGILWLLLTVAFEFLGGHFLFGAPWPKLLADYNLARGKIWVVVLIVTFLTPRLIYQWNEGGRV